MKKSITNILVLFVVIFATSNIYGQGWVSTFGTVEHEYILDAVEVPGGGYAITGSSDGMAIVGRVSADGDSLWVNYNINIEDQSEGNAIINTSDGGFAIAGFSINAGLNRKVLLAKLAANGDLLWSQLLSFQPPNPQVTDIAYDLVQTPDGGYLLAGTAEDQLGLLKTDAQGNLEWNNFYEPVEFQHYYTQRIFPQDNGNYVIAGYSAYVGDAAPDALFLFTTDLAGNQVDFDYHYLEEVNVNDIIQTTDGGYLYIGDHELHKLNSEGDLLWSNQSVLLGEDRELMAATNAVTGDIMIVGPTLTSVPVYFTLISQEGNILWTNIVESPGTTLKWVQNIITTSDGGYLLTGEGFVSGQFGDLKRQFWLMKVDNLGQLYTNNLRGAIYIDDNQNCQFDTGETTLVGQVMQADGEENFYGLSAFNGLYSMLVDTGDYTLKVLPSSGPYWAVCPDSLNVSIIGPSDTIYQDFGLTAIVDCPYLEVDLSAPFLRRCFESTYTVNYCNHGTIVAENAFVEITLDPFLEFLSSTIPETSQQDNVYTFDLGEIGVNECGQFQIDVNVSCDAELGQTHCTEAHIYPDSLCLPMTWLGPTIVVEATCIGDTIEFLIINNGGDMTEEQMYIVTEDNIILMQDNFQLGSGQEERFSIFASGSTYRLEAAQANDFPTDLGSSFSSVSVEGCNGFSPGFVTLFPEDDGASYLSLDCQENIGAFDPNDKRAFPAGYGDEHFIARNTDLEYHIRFQNTGTDTAFTVVIRDTLDPNLNIASVRPGATSHSYEFDLYGNGILEFTFDDILLPDSNINEPASHGFVKFRIAQKPDLPNGTVIKNAAGIYFDFNHPVITNQTWHTIGENFIQVVDVEDFFGPQVKTVVAPNPFSEETYIRIEGLELPKGGTLYLFDALGKVVKTQVFQNNPFRLNAARLPAGIYLFQIQADGNLISSGKVMVR